MLTNIYLITNISYRFWPWGTEFGQIWTDFDLRKPNVDNFDLEKIEILNLKWRNVDRKLRPILLNPSSNQTANAMRHCHRFNRHPTGLKRTNSPKLVDDLLNWMTAVTCVALSCFNWLINSFPPYPCALLLRD